MTLLQGSGGKFKNILPILAALCLVGTQSILAGAKYGPFRDEMYYQACAQKLAWGYVDHPPLSVALLRIWTDVFSTSEVAVRSLSAAVSLSTVAVVGGLTRRVGGSGLAVGMASMVVAASPVLRVVGFLYSPNTLDMLMWALAVWAWHECLFNRKSVWRWVVLGLMVGLVCLNRLNGFWLILALVVGSSFGGYREVKTRLVMTALACTGLILAPWLIWQGSNGWPTVEFVRHADANKLNAVSPLQFLVSQVFVMNLFAAPIWIAGLVEGMKAPQWRSWSAAFLTVVAILLINGKSRENYLSPAYVFLIPIGCMRVVERLSRPVVLLYGTVLAASGFAMGLICLPILPAEKLYQVLSALPTPPATEKGAKSALQGLADTEGWPEMARQTFTVWRTAPVGAAVFTENYGEASALAKYGPALGLPRPICPHNQFWIWGPGDWNGRDVVLIGNVSTAVLRSFDRVSAVGTMDLAWATPEEAHAPIRVAHGLKMPVREFWAMAKRYE